MIEGTGIIDEHAPRGTNADAGRPENVYQPTPEERSAIKLANKIYERNRRHRAQYDQKWVDYYNMFRGKQWKEIRPSYRHSEVINLIHRALQSSVPIQLDAHPRFEFLPRDPSDYEISQIMEEVAEADWDQNNWGMELVDVIWDSNLYGTGLSSMLIKEYQSQPKLVYASADPFYAFPDPEARDVNKNAAIFGFDHKSPTFVYAEPIDVRQIRKKYPEVKDFIKADLQDLLQTQKTSTQPIKFRSPIDNKSTYEGYSTENYQDKDRALLITVYLSPEYCAEDFTEEKKIDVDPETQAPVESYVQKAKYPNGRKIVICNNILCEDVDLGYDDQEFPFSRFPNYILPREFWGQSEIEQLEGPQKTFNKVVSFVLDVLTLMGNPIWVLPNSTGIDPENLISKPGLVIPYDGENPPHREEGTQLQPYVMQLIQSLGEWFDSISGSQDITRGVNPSGVTAASAISTLQEAAQTRIRQKARNLDFYLQSVGQQYVSRVFQFYTVPKIFRLTNNEGVSKYFKMHVEPYQPLHPEGHPQAGQPSGDSMYKVHYQPMGENGQYDPSQAKIFETRGELDVRVSSGSSLPFAKDQLENKLLAYFDRGIIDDEEVLKRSDYPNYASVLQRVQVKKQQAAQAAAQAGKPSPTNTPKAG